MFLYIYFNYHIRLCSIFLSEDSKIAYLYDDVFFYLIILLLLPLKYVSPREGVLIQLKPANR